MSIYEYVKEFTAIRADYEERLNRAQNDLATCLASLKEARDRAERAERERDNLIALHVAPAPPRVGEPGGPSLPASLAELRGVIDRECETAKADRVSIATYPLGDVVERAKSLGFSKEAPERIS